MSKEKIISPYIEVGEFKSIVLKQIRILSREITFRCRYPENYKELQSYIYPNDFSWSQKLFHYLNSDLNFELGKCAVCGNRCNFLSVTRGYSKYCSKECYGNDSVNWKTKEILNMSKEDILDLLKNHPNGYIEEYKFKKIFPKHYNEIMKWKFPYDFKWTQKLYHYLHNDKELNLGKCPVCGNRCAFHRFGRGYKKHCSQKCKSIDPEVQSKTKKTCLKLYGKVSYAQTDESKERIRRTTFERYGVECYAKTKESKEKARKTCLDRYGEICYSKTYDWSSKRRKRIKYDGLTFDSSWEVKVYQYCKENNIPCEYQPNIQFEYEYDGKTHIYQPDFLINGKIYEVKGNQFFDDDKMICSYNRNEYDDGIAESKHQCMLKNNVIILKEDDVKNIEKRCLN